MALTEEEKKLFKAYNIGYLMSQHEPALVDKIIKGNLNNEFVKMMAVGRDHHHFHVNMPRKDNTREFKNGYHNGRTLAEHDPEMIRKLMTTKGLHKDYKRGLEAANKEYTIKQIGKKIDELPKIPAKELRRDVNFKKGFNVGYQFAERQSLVIDYAKTANEQYSKFLDGMKAGHNQYKHDLELLREKKPEATISKGDRQASLMRDELTNHKISAISEVSRDQFKLIDSKDTHGNVPAPKWLQEKTKDKENNTPKKDKSKDIDLDR